MPMLERVRARSAALRRRARLELRDALELVLLPGLAAVLPWRWCFALFKRIARWSWLYRAGSEADWVQAQAMGFGGDRAQWLWQRRLVQLVDHADHYLHRTRSDRWLAQHVQVHGDWMALGVPAFLFTFHWGAGMWGLRHAHQAGLRVHAMAAPADGAAFAGRWVLKHYALARLRSIEQALGRPLVLVPKGLRNLRKALQAQEQVLVLIDVPQDQGGGEPVTLLGHRVRLPAAMPQMAVQQGAPCAIYITGLDVLTGRRSIQIVNLPAGLETPQMMAQLVAFLERLVVEQPALWHFWGQWPRFTAP